MLGMAVWGERFEDRRGDIWVCGVRLSGGAVRVSRRRNCQRLTLWSLRGPGWGLSRTSGRRSCWGARRAGDSVLHAAMGEIDSGGGEGDSYGVREGEEFGGGGESDGPVERGVFGEGGRAGRAAGDPASWRCEKRAESAAAEWVTDRRAAGDGRNDPRIFGGGASGD